jgi:hypothetical protein
MSDSFEMLVDIDATAQEAEPLASAVVDRLRNLGLISGSLNSDCVLGKMEYRPGPAVPDSYVLEPREGRFWELHTCGVEPKIGRGFNMWALGPVCGGLTCPSCRFHVQPFDAELGDVVGAAINEWLEQTGPALVRCPRCHQQLSIAEWECKPPLGFGNLSFKFWNWPPLDSSSWKIDIAAIVRDCTGHTIVRTYGHI